MSQYPDPHHPQEPRPGFVPGYDAPGQGAPGDHGAPTGPAYGAPGPAYGAPYPGAPGHGPGVPSDRGMAVLAHLSTLVAALLTGGWMVILGPLVMWLVYKDRDPFVRQAAAGAFNFAVWINVVMLLGWIFTITFVGAIVGIPLLLVAGVATIVVPILAAVKANDGLAYRYPLTPTLLR